MNPIKTTKRSVAEEIARKMGFKIAPPDHPIYSEGTSIVLLPKGRKRPKVSKAVPDKP